MDHPQINANRGGSAWEPPRFSSFHGSFGDGTLSAVDLRLHPPVLGLGDEALLQEYIVVIMEPHPLHNDLPPLFVGQILLLCHDPPPLPVSPHSKMLILSYHCLLFGRHML